MADLPKIKQEQKTAWTYERFFSKIKAYVNDEDPIFGITPRLFLSLAKRKDERVDIEANKAELVWLQYNLGFIKRVVNTKLASGMFYHLAKGGFQSFYTREMALKTGASEQSVNRWALRFMEKDLFHKRPLNYDRRMYYVLHKTHPLIIRLIFDLILWRYSPAELEAYLRKDREKAVKVEKRKAQVRKARREHYKKNRFYSHKISRTATGTY